MANRAYSGQTQPGDGRKSPNLAYTRPPDPTDEPGTLAYVEDQLDRCRRRDYPWHALYYLCAANFVGRQWATFNPRSRALEEPRVPSSKILLTFNQILPMILREASKLSLGRMPWTVVPTSDDEDAIAAARLDGKLLDHFWEINGMRRTESHANLVRTMFGMCFVEPDWDNTLGKIVRKGFHEVGSPGNRSLPEYEGGAVARIISPFQVSADQDATEPDELRFLAYTKMTDVGKLRLKYDRGDQVIPEQPDEQAYLEYRMQYLSSHYFQTLTSQGDYDRFPHHARFTKFWYYPDDEWPEGREIHKAGNIILYDDKWQHEYLLNGPQRRHPLKTLYYTKVPLRYRGMGMVENLLEPQWEYNKKRSQWVMILNRMAKPKWMAAKGHKMAYAPNDQTGEFLEYNIDPLNPGGKPEAITPNIPTGDFEIHCARTLSDMQNTASQHEVSYGRTPPGVSAGVAIEQLIAQDDAAKGLPVHDAIATWQEVGTALLGIYQQYAGEEMVISLAGRNYQHEFHTWKRGSSDPNARVQIISDGSLPLTRGQKREAVKELVAIQLLDPMMDRNKILQFLEFGQLEEVFAQFNRDVMSAKRENRVMLETDTVPQVYPEDDHEVHIVEHTQAIKARRELDAVVAGRMRSHLHMHLYFKGMMGDRLASLAAGAEVGMDMAAERVGDEVDRELPNEPEQGQRVPDRGQSRPESGAVMKQKPGSPNGGQKSGTPGNQMRERKQKEKQ